MGYSVWTEISIPRHFILADAELRRLLDEEFGQEDVDFHIEQSANTGIVSMDKSEGRAKFEEIEEYCRNNSIPFDRQHEAHPEHSAFRWHYRPYPENIDDEYPIDNDGDAVVAVHELRDIIRHASGTDDIIDQIKELCDSRIIDASPLTDWVKGTPAVAVQLSLELED